MNPDEHERAHSQHDRLRPRPHSTAHGEIVVSLKSVNHRGLDMHFHLAADLDALREHAMRAALKKAVLRGHVDVRCSVVALRRRRGGRI